MLKVSGPPFFARMFPFNLSTLWNHTGTFSCLHIIGRKSSPKYFNRQVERILETQPMAPDPIFGPPSTFDGHLADNSECWISLFICT